jgi:hypothetical protein
MTEQLEESQSTESTQQSTDSEMSKQQSGGEQPEQKQAEQAVAAPSFLTEGSGPTLKAPGVKGVGTIVPMYSEEASTRILPNGETRATWQGIRVRGNFWKLNLSGASRAVRNAFSKAADQMEGRDGSRRVSKVDVDAQGNVIARESTPGLTAGNRTGVNLRNLFTQDYDPYTSEEDGMRPVNAVYTEDGEVQLTQSGQHLLKELRHIKSRYRDVAQGEGEFYQEGFSPEGVLTGYVNVIVSMALAWPDTFALDHSGEYPELEAEEGSAEGAHFVALMKSDGDEASEEDSKGSEPEEIDFEKL